MALTALMAAVLATAMAAWKGAEDWEKGLYGFNAALIGLAVAQVPQTAWQDLLLVGLLGLSAVILSTFATHFLIRRKFPVFTAPFVVSTWFLLAPLLELGLLPPFAGAPAGAEDPMLWHQMLFWSFGQILFLNDSISGALVLCGLAISSPRVALWACGAAVLAALFGILAGWPYGLISQGLFGYNAVLTCVALMPLAWPWRVAGILLSGILMHGFQAADWPALTAPFVLSSWLVLFAAHSFRKAGMGRSRA